MLFIIFYMPCLCVYYWMLILKVTHGGSLTERWATVKLEMCLPPQGQGGEGRAVDRSRAAGCVQCCSRPPAAPQKVTLPWKAADHTDCSHHRLPGQLKVRARHQRLIRNRQLSCSTDPVLHSALGQAVLDQVDIK